MSVLSDSTLINLVLVSDTPEGYNKLLEYRKQVGQTACVRQMLTLFNLKQSPELCRKSWEVALTICLTDSEPQMDKEASRLWTNAILSALQDESEDIRKVAADAFSFALNEKDFDRSVIQALIEGLADESSKVRQACGYALELAGLSSISHLLDSLADTRYHKPHENAGDRCSSVWDILYTIDRILSRHEITSSDRNRFAEALYNFMKDRSPTDGMDYLDIWKAGESLGEYVGGKAGLEKLSILAQHPDPRVRASVAHGLSHIKDEVAQQNLRDLSDDPIESVRHEAIKYLSTLP